MLGNWDSTDPLFLRDSRSITSPTATSMAGAMDFSRKAGSGTSEVAKVSATDLVRPVFV